MLKIYALFLIPFLLTGCKDQDQLVEIRSKVADLEKRVLELEKIPPKAENWVLWQSTEWVNPNLINNFGWPKILSAYTSRDECLVAARSWSTPSSKVVNVDPHTIQVDAVRYIYRCLPPDVSPKR